MKLAVLLVLCVSVLSGGPTLGQETSQPDAPPGVEVLKVKWESYVTGVQTSTIPANAEVNQNRLLVPGQNVSAPVQLTTMYRYSAELSNSGPKAIKGVVWDFIFTDAANNAQLGRHSFASFQKIEVNQKKTIEFRTQASPPKLVSIAGLKKDQRSPVSESIKVRCLAFTDGTFWEHPNSKNACKDLQLRLDNRKK